MVMIINETLTSDLEGVVHKLAYSSECTWIIMQKANDTSVNDIRGQGWHFFHGKLLFSDGIYMEMLPQLSVILWGHQLNSLTHVLLYHLFGHPLRPRI